MTTINGKYRCTFAPASDGYLYAANGVDKMWKWDGSTSDPPAVAAGLPSPTTALSMSADSSASTSDGIFVKYAQTYRAGCAYDSTNQYLYVLDDSNNIVRFDANGLALATSIAATGATWRSMCIDRNDVDKIYISSTYNATYASTTDNPNVYTPSTTSRAVHSPNVDNFQNCVSLTHDPTNNILHGSQGTSIRRVDLDTGGTAADTVTGLTNCYACYWNDDDSKVYYFTGSTNQTLWKADSDGSNQEQIGIQTAGVVNAMYIDEANGVLYYCIFQTGAARGMWSVNLDGSNHTELVSDDFETSESLTYSGQLQQRADGAIFVPDNTNSQVRIVAPSGGTSGITGDYYAYVQFGDADGNWGAVSPISAILSATNATTISYTSVPTTSDTRVTTKRILRNTAGQASIFYEDVVLAVAATTSSSTKTDAQLEASTAVPVYSSAGANLVLGFTEPPSDRSIVHHHQGRLFAAGEVIYKRGSVVMTNGDATVTGVETYWQDELEGRFFRVLGDATIYEIDSYTSATELELTTTFAGSTGIYEYEIKPPAATRNILYWSRSTDFGQWDSSSGIAIGDPNLPITGLFSLSGLLYVAQANILHRLIYSENPGDGQRFDAAFRGCVNHRCIGELDGTVFLLDQTGPYIYDGKNANSQFSSAVAPLFRGKTNDRFPRINWKAKEAFHVLVDRQERVVRWFVCFGQDPLPRNAVCYGVDDGSWFLESYPDYIGGSAQNPIESENPIVSYSSHSIVAIGVNPTDIARPSDGNLRWPVSKATLLTVEVDPSYADLPTNVSGAPVTIVSGRGEGQTRIIAEQCGPVFEVTQPWGIQPDSTSIMQIGGIPWSWRSSRMRMQRSEVATGQQVGVTYRPTKKPGSFRIRDIKGLDQEPEAINTRKVGTTVETSDRGGYAMHEISEPYTRAGGRPDGIKIELSGVSNADRVRIYQVDVDGTFGNPEQK